MTFEEIFTRSFIPLQQVFGYELTPEVLQIYGTHLSKRLTPELFAKACIHVIDNFKPTASCRFPTPAHFVEYAQGNAEEMATLAATRVIGAVRRIGRYKSVSFDDLALHRVIDRFGGWESMCDWDDDKWQYNEKRFKQAYMAEVKAGENVGPQYLVGCHERTNNATRASWTRGKEDPLLISHVGASGQEAKLLPPPKQDLPKVEALPLDVEWVQEIAKKMGAA